ncbi:MAG: C39 family peptidase [Hungatella sp.]
MKFICNVLKTILLIGLIGLLVWYFPIHISQENDLRLLSSLPNTPSTAPTFESSSDSVEAGSNPPPSPTCSSYGENSVIPCTMGLFVYYSQSDPRWADALYGPSDPIRSHGCGPVAVAMVVSSLTSAQVTPIEVSTWADDHGYCSPGEGSRHALIPDGLSHYGLTVTSVSDRSKESIIREIQSGNVVVALMNKGFFTNGGHFLLLTQVTEDGQLRIADCASWENTQKAWDPEFILSQVRKSAEAGGPLWSVGLPAEY